MPIADAALAIRPFHGWVRRPSRLGVRSGDGLESRRRRLYRGLGYAIEERISMGKELGTLSGDGDA